MARKRSRSLREKLEVARAEKRGMAQAIRTMPGEPYGPSGPGILGLPTDTRFVQIVAVNRGYTGILHALDASGQVWQQRTILGPKEAGGKAPVQDQWWEKVEMKRK